MQEKPLKSNMYDWITKKPNPLGGACMHKCSYCYVEKMKSRYPALKAKYSGEPKLFESVLNAKYKDSDVVFVADCTDLFAENVPAPLIQQILKKYAETEAKLLFQTKNPKRIPEFTHLIPENSIICTTIETNRWYIEMGFAPHPTMRAGYMALIDKFPKYVTIEPIMDFDLLELVNLIKLANPVQVNIGADSGHNHLPEPSKEKILELISELSKITTVKQKTNLQRLLK